MNKLELIQQYCSVQAENESLWFIPETITEDLLLKELRKLVWMIEEATDEDIINEINVIKG